LLLWTFDSQHRALNRPGDASYYWTNVYYWLQDNAASTPGSDIVNALDAFPSYAARENNIRTSFRVRCASWSYDVTTTRSEPGSYGPSIINWFIPWYFRLLAYDADDNVVGYKRLRGCWGFEDVAEGQMVDDLYDYLRVGLDAYLTPQPLCNVRGVPIVRWEIDRTLRNWQLRHGSKRAARPVLA
jgi:hypothetical protein